MADELIPAPEAPETAEQMIERIFLAHGFTKKPQEDGTEALNDYVFKAAHALIEEALNAEAMKNLLPSRFQLNDWITASDGKRYQICGVSFVLMDFNDGWGEGGKIIYQLRDQQGNTMDILSNFAEEKASAPPPKHNGLRLVVSNDGASEEPSGA